MAKHNTSQLALNDIRDLKSFAKQYLANFETDEQIKERRASMLRAFENLGETNTHPYTSYKSCKINDPCNTGGCPRCDALNRMRETKALTDKINQMVDSGARIITFTGIPKECQLSKTKLTQLNLKKVWDRMRKAYGRHIGPHYKTYAWMSCDVSYEPKLEHEKDSSYKSKKPGYYAPHVHGIICIWGYQNASESEWKRVKKRLRRKMKKALFPNPVDTRKPLQFAKCTNLSSWISYGMKSTYGILGSFSLPSPQRAKYDVPMRIFFSKTTPRRRYLEINTKGATKPKASVRPK
jgi:hypothetical protein